MAYIKVLLYQDHTSSQKLTRRKGLNKVRIEYDGKVLFLLQSYDCKEVIPAPICKHPGNCRFFNGNDENDSDDELIFSNTTMTPRGLGKLSKRAYLGEKGSESIAKPVDCRNGGTGLGMLPGIDDLRTYNLSAADFMIRYVNKND